MVLPQDVRQRVNNQVGEQKASRGGDEPFKEAFGEGGDHAAFLAMMISPHTASSGYILDPVSTAMPPEPKVGPHEL